MTNPTTSYLAHPDCFYIDGLWVTPSSTDTIEVLDSHTEATFLVVAEARVADIDRAVTAARRAFDLGPWPQLTHDERAGFLRAMAAGVRSRAGQVGQTWPRETGVLHRHALHGAEAAALKLERAAALASTFPFEEPATPTEGGERGLIIREPVGVVGAIIPWNGPLGLIANKIGPALLAGCTVVVKMSPEAPAEGYVVAEVADDVGLPPGVLNMVTADREVSELLVRDPRVDKITFTGSTAAGRRIGSLCGDRIARCTLELGGKSAAIVLDDADLTLAAAALATAQCRLSGQVCAALSRVIVVEDRHDALVDALAAAFADVVVGDPFDPASGMGPLAAERQRDRVERYIACGVAEGAELVTGGRRPTSATTGWYVEPTLFARVDNRSTIAQEEIFGPVLAVVPARDEAHAVDLANDSIYGLNGAAFTQDEGRALAIARRLRTGTVGHNAFRADFGIAFGGFKQSGIGREGGREGLLPYLEVKTVILG